MRSSVESKVQELVPLWTTKTAHTTELTEPMLPAGSSG